MDLFSLFTFSFQSKRTFSICSRETKVEMKKLQNISRLHRRNEASQASELKELAGLTYFVFLVLFFKKMDHPRPLFVYFRLFKQT